MNTPYDGFDDDFPRNNAYKVAAYFAAKSAKISLERLTGQLRSETTVVVVDFQSRSRPDDE